MKVPAGRRMLSSRQLKLVFKVIKPDRSWRVKVAGVEGRKERREVNTLPCSHEVKEKEGKKPEVCTLQERG